jgi:hypothetical protein
LVFGALTPPCLLSAHQSPAGITSRTLTTLRLRGALCFAPSSCTWKCPSARSVRVTRRKVANVHGVSVFGSARALGDQLYHGVRGTATSAQLSLDLCPLNLQAFAPSAARSKRRCTVDTPSAPSREPQSHIHAVEHSGIVDPAVHVGAVDAAVRIIALSCTRAPTPLWTCGRTATLRVDHELVAQHDEVRLAPRALRRLLVGLYARRSSRR